MLRKNVLNFKGMDFPQAAYQSVIMQERNEEVIRGKVFQLVSLDSVFRERNVT